MHCPVSRTAGLTAAFFMALSTPIAAEVEHVRLDQSCNGKTGRAIASYSWFEGVAMAREHVFTDLCLDLDAMRIFGVENSDILRPAYEAPGQMAYHAFPLEDSDSYKETVTLSTDMLFYSNYEEVMEDPEGLPRPQDPDVPSTFVWVKGSNARPLDRIGSGTASFRGFVDGALFEGSVPTGRHAGYAEHMAGTNEAAAMLSGLGFHMEADLTVTETGAQVQMQAPSQVAVVDPAIAELTLEFQGDEITGRGTFQAEHAALSPETEKVWSRFDLEAVGVTGKLTGQAGEQMYVLVIWEGTYTDFEGESFPADSVMTFNARLED